MYELVKLTDKSYYIESPAKVGLVLTCENEAVLIDSGSDKDAAKKVKRQLDENGWTLKTILNTHSHADHIGGNKYLQTQTGCKIYANGIERDFTVHPILEPSLLYGGSPIKELQHKFLMAQPSDAELLTDEVMPKGIEIILLPGHSFDMVGYRTNDGTVYLADCLSSAETLDKYKIGYLYDVSAYLETLEKVKTMDGNIFVPSHAQVTENIAPLAQLNIDRVMETGEHILSICSEPKIFEEILQKLFELYELRMTFEQYSLVGSAVRAYLSWLKEKEALSAEIDGARIVWKKN